MPASLLLILIIVALMFSVLSFVAKKLIGFLTGILLLSFVIFGIWWFVKAHQMPLEINKVSRHEIKVVTYPDGSSKQMFSVNGIHYNVHEKWHQVVDEKEWEIEVIEPVTKYFGLTYEDYPSCKVKFNLVRKEKK